ncbi:hypothetical protein CCUS01_10722 [Colletotrichum cuscutae]|uniref:Uncharacterized protein n=1 Tax=Colletotrichum cuscutae TaxID=1209917 RepID=A0AAI9U6L4_9PEZI|nr:hypothetical protein CCUS01_10722 [Colletotrichum cuscutae]
MESRANGHARPPTNTIGIALSRLTSTSDPPHDRHTGRDHQGFPSNNYHENNDTASQRYSNANRNRRREPSRHLTAIDVAALIINKMIGTGIFAFALGLWFCVADASNSMIMYLEFARKLPFTGGELVYNSSLLTICFIDILYWQLLSTHSTSFSSIQRVRIIKGPSQFRSIELYEFLRTWKREVPTVGWAGHEYPEVELDFQSDSLIDIQPLDGNVLRFLAVSVTTAICMMLYLSNSNSRLINRVTALLKLILLLVIACFGISFLRSSDSKLEPRDIAKPKWQTNATLRLLAQSSDFIRRELNGL